jgi:hypothetical protein
MRVKYSSVIREFQSPLGIGGAYFALFIYLLGVVSFVGNFNNEYYLSVLILICTWLIITIYYFVYAKSVQTFSDDEQQSLFKFHVINLNKQKQRKIKMNKNNNNNNSNFSKFNRTSLSFSVKSNKSVSNLRRSIEDVGVLLTNSLFYLSMMRKSYIRTSIISNKIKKVHVVSSLLPTTADSSNKSFTIKRSSEEAMQFVDNNNSDSGNNDALNLNLNNNDSKNNVIEEDNDKNIADEVSIIEWKVKN